MYRGTVMARLGIMASIALYTSKPGQFQFLQAIIGVQMWRCGSSEKVNINLFTHKSISALVKTLPAECTFCAEFPPTPIHRRRRYSGHMAELLSALDM